MSAAPKGPARCPVTLKAGHSDVIVTTQEWGGSGAVRARVTRHLVRAGESQVFDASEIKYISPAIPGSTPLPGEVTPA